MGPAHVTAVAGRRQEVRRVVTPGAGHLLRDTADGAHRAVGRNLAGTSNEPTAGEIAWRQLVDDAEREHHPCARTTDVEQVVLHLERPDRPEVDTDDRAG